MPSPGTSPSQRTFHLEPFFGLRTPLLPHDERKAWSDGLRSARLWEDNTAFLRAYEDDCALLRQRLREVVERPLVREALWVASPDLVDSLPRWYREPGSEKGQRTEMALVRYFNRMCHRPTPFGLFAGHSMGRAGGRTHLGIASQSAYRRKTRLDFDFLCGLVQEIQSHRELRATLTYRPNNSLYPSAGRLRYAEARIVDGVRDLQLIAVQEDAYLHTVLEGARQGAGLEELARSLVDDEIGWEESFEFIHELIDKQVLVPDLEPATTGPEPLPALIAALEGVAATKPMAGRLVAAMDEMAGLDALGLGNASERYVKLAEGLEGLPVKVERSRLWQVDLFKPAPDATLGAAVREDLERGVELLLKVSPHMGIDPFLEFKEAFAKRYEQAWVPLVEALDPESGVGFPGTGLAPLQGAPLLNDLTPAIAPRAPHPEDPLLAPREAWLLKRITRLREQGHTTLELSSGDLETLAKGVAARLPDSFYCVVELAASSALALEQGDYLACLIGGSGPSAARLLGRFCHGDPELSGEVSRHLQREEACRPNAVFAEIAHLPYGRMGNVLARPILRSHEIPFLGASGVDPHHRIGITDLFVGIRDGRVVLWSKSLDKEVLPRLSSAANYTGLVTDLYRFLGLLQQQGLQGTLGWSWGNLDGETWLPRVVHGRFVLQRALWRIGQTELGSLKGASSAAERFRVFQGLRRELELPRHLLLADGDNELPVDLENPLCVETLWSVVKKRDAFRLVEDFPGEDGLLLHGPEGAFTHELVLCFLADAPPPAPAAPKLVLGKDRPRHAPGSDWLYAKLYTGLATADQVLDSTLAPLVRGLLSAERVDRWFFIRYHDPDSHLRLRLHGDPERLWGSVLPELRTALEPLLSDGRLWKFQIDTYEPECDRYGGPHNLGNAERVFQADSEAVLELLSLYPGDEGSDARWKLALRSVDEFYCGLGWTLEERCRMASHFRDRCAQEFGVRAGNLEHQLGTRFRSERRSIEAVLAAEEDIGGSTLLAGIRILEARSRIVNLAFAEMRRLESQGMLTHPMNELAGSLVHMSVNRLLRSSQHLQEMVIYDFLARVYKSRLARARQEHGRKAQKDRTLAVPGTGHDALISEPATQ